MSVDLSKLDTAWKASEALASGRVKARELAEASVAGIRALEPSLHSFLHTMEEKALRDADRFDANPGAFADNPLAGIPCAVKDNLCTIGEPTTCASRILEGWKPPYDATVVKQITEAGGVIVGKTNLDEFAMGSSTENSGFQTTRNPWDIQCVPGGSSGGSAAAVASGEVFYALGSDTGGSIRQPASFCGVVGLKPTYGRVSRYGLVAYASSLDQIGPLTRDVRDAALVMNLISRHDPKDSTSYPEPAPDYTRCLVKDVKGFTVGVPRELFAQGVGEEVAKAVWDGISLLEKMGAKISEISLPSLEYGLPVYYIIAPAEASSNLARYDGVRYGIRAQDAKDHIDMFMKTRARGFGAEVKQRIMIGTYALSAGYYDAYYLKAQQARTLIRREFEEAFQQCDVLIGPTAPSAAFRIGQNADDPFQMKLSDVCTIPVNLAGIPGISIPCGFSDGKPLGMQIMAPSFGEEKLFQVAYSFEQSTDFHTVRPPFYAGGRVEG